MAIRRSVLLAAALLAGGTLATPAQAQRCVDNNAKTPAEAFCLLARGERQGSSCYRCEWTNSCQRSAVSIPCAQGIFVSSNARDIKALQECVQLTPKFNKIIAVKHFATFLKEVQEFS